MSWRLLGCALICGLSAGCGEVPSAEPIVISFAARMGQDECVIGRTYEGIGATRASFTPTDLRFYLFDVRVTLDDGTEVPVALTEDGIWQNEGLALIDFEAGAEGGTPATNDVVVGEVPSGVRERVVGLRFRVGVPESRNHLNVDLAPSPLNLTSMFWTWTTGYKFARIEGVSDAGHPFLFHFAASSCTDVGCDVLRPSIELGPFDSRSDVIAVDLAALLQSSSVDQSDGCMSDPEDPDCFPLLTAFGLPHSSEQRVFRVESR